jgi:hypothetical protein
VGISDGAITWQLTPDRRQQPGQVVPGRAGLTAGSQPAGITKAANEPADRDLVVDDPVDLGDLLVGREDPHRDRVAAHIQTKMDGA